jgi:hypothetical protein
MEKDQAASQGGQNSFGLTNIHFLRRLFWIPAAWFGSMPRLPLSHDSHLTSGSSLLIWTILGSGKAEKAGSGKLW